LSLDELRGKFDAVLLAIGAQVSADVPLEALDPVHGAASGGKGETGKKVEPDLAFARSLGLDCAPRGVKVDRQTMATNLPKVFAAGGFASGPGYAVHAAATGHRAAVSINQLSTADRWSASGRSSAC